MLTHPLAEEHPWRLEDVPAEVLTAWSADCLPQHDGDRHACADGLTLIAVIPPPRTGELP